MKIRTLGAMEYVPCDTWSSEDFQYHNVTDDEFVVTDRKHWRKRVVEGHRRTFYGLIVMKPTPFGTAFFRKNGGSVGDYWEVLNLRKPAILGWVP